MGKKNYSKFSEHFKKSEEVIEETKNEMIEEVKEVTEEEPETEIVTGVVVNCDKLNIREKPSTDSKVLRIVKKDEELGIYPTPVDGFYKVVRMETEGYCMMNFIKLK